MPGQAGATVTLVTDELISRAQAGDDGAFRALTEPHLRELQVHCYRMRSEEHTSELQSL